MWDVGSGRGHVWRRLIGRLRHQGFRFVEQRTLAGCLLGTRPKPLVALQAKLFEQGGDLADVLR